jgi:threonine/homoserine/homoserine lactone efflux protein
MMHFLFFIQGAALGLPAGAAPGPLQTYLISETLTGGWRRSLPLIFVPVISDLPIILLTTFFLGQLPDIAIQAISVIGGLFVFYLAWGLWKNWRSNHQDALKTTGTSSRSFGKAVVMNLLNPNPYIFWTFVSGPILLEAFEKTWAHAITFLLGFYGTFLATMVFLIILFHQTRRLGPQVVNFIQLGSILVLILFGGILIKEGLLGILG